MTTASPFIIWTLQRTGGTNLTNNLLALSPFRAQHEPFNYPRVYGEITKAWDEDGDNEALFDRITEVCEKGENLKHCVEMIPWRISATLADAAAKAGYRHLFLVRNSSLQRLLSMEYAQRTKVWGPSHEKPDPNCDPAFDEPLNVEKLLKRETMAFERLNTFWKRLEKNGCEPAVISFEQVYDASFEDACKDVARVIDHLGLQKDGLDVSAIVKQMRDSGNQQTRDRYSRFVGIEKLQEALRKRPELEFLK